MNDNKNEFSYDLIASNENEKLDSENSNYDLINHNENGVDVREVLMIYFNNDFNNALIEGTTERENKLLMLILAKIKRKGTEKVNIPYEDMVKYLNIDNLYPAEFKRIFVSLGEKVNATLVFRENKNAKFVGYINVFPVWLYNQEDDSITVSINEYFSYMTNDFEKGNYTAMRMNSYSQLKGSHSQLLYKYLSQWKSVGKAHFSLSDFCVLMNVPKSYVNDPRRIKPRIIDKAINDNYEMYNEVFKNLKVEITYRRNKIDGFTFSWKPTYGTGLTWKEEEEEKKEVAKIRADMLEKLKNSY